MEVKTYKNRPNEAIESNVVPRKINFDILKSNIFVKLLGSLVLLAVKLEMNFTLGKILLHNESSSSGVSQ